jgi:hypothetical protein
MSLPALYVLAAEYRDALEQMSDLDLPPEVIADTLESLQYPIEVKASNVIRFVRNLEVAAEAIKAAAKAQMDRAKAIENRANGLRAYVKSTMENLGIQKIDTPDFALSIRKNPPAVEIFDERQIPQSFLRVPEPPPPAPDKAAIAAALKAGQDVPGAVLKHTTRLAVT